MKRVDQWELVILVAKHVFGAQGMNVSSFRVANALDKLARIARTLDRLNE